MFPQLFLTPAQKQLHKQLKFKSQQLQQTILRQQEELRQITEELTLAQQFMPITDAATPGKNFFMFFYFLQKWVWCKLIHNIYCTVVKSSYSEQCNETGIVVIMTCHLTGCTILYSSTLFVLQYLRWWGSRVVTLPGKMLSGILSVIMS